VEICRLGAAPLGDPLEFELRGYRLSLRKSEAGQVEIEDVSR
jgi:ferrous iron transport protein A